MLKETNDDLFQSFKRFELDKSETKFTRGGKSATGGGQSTDPDGCTALWGDWEEGGVWHVEDHRTCEN